MTVLVEAKPMEVLEAGAVSGGGGSTVMAKGVEGDTAGGEDGGSTAMVSSVGLGAALGLLGGGVFEESVICLRELAGEALLVAAGLVADDLVPFVMGEFCEFCGGRCRSADENDRCRKSTSSGVEGNADVIGCFCKRVKMEISERKISSGRVSFRLKLPGGYCGHRVNRMVESRSKLDVLGGKERAKCDR